MKHKYDERCKKILESKTNFKFIKVVKEHVTPSRSTIHAECENGHVSEKALNNIVNRGCSKCLGRRPKGMSLDDIIDRLRENNFQLLRWEEDLKKPAILRCKVCDYQFEIGYLHNAFASKQCMKCANHVRMEPHEIVIACAHNGWSLNWIDYDEDKYTTSVFRARCQKCGTKHKGAMLKGFISGDVKCRTCYDVATGGFDTTKPATLYYLRVVHEGITYYKIGITNRTVKERFNRGDDFSKITVLSELHHEEGWKILELEKYFLKTYSEYRYKGEPILASSGSTELFVKDVLELDNP